MDCIFCNIAKGSIDSAKVWEDKDVFAFLDIHPVTRGHCLVIPKKHFENIFDIDEDILKKIIVAVKRLSTTLQTSLKADGIRISQSNGKTAGQAVFHFHTHIIPRYENDGVTMHEVTTLTPQQGDLEELKNIANNIKNNL